jgi:predicted GNAT superfamily acetyltransferase
VELPEDIEALRKSDIDLARVWRRQLREVLKPALDDGWFIANTHKNRTAVLVEPGTSDYEFSED